MAGWPTELLTEDSTSSCTGGASRHGDLGKHGPAFHPGQNFTQVLELPYAGEELSMLVLLPDDHVPLSLVSVLRALPARLALEPLLPLLGVLARVPEHKMAHLSAR